MSWQEPQPVETGNFTVVINQEEQYSIWPAHKPLPPGWDEVGKTTTKTECLAYIKEVWTDLRPLSLRKQMEADAQSQPTAWLAPSDACTPQSNLVERLTAGVSAVSAISPVVTSAGAFKETLNDGYIYLQFTQGEVETRLGVRLDAGSCDLSRADFENATGCVHLEGNLILNFVKVRCIADLEMHTLQGTGRLESLAA